MEMFDVNKVDIYTDGSFSEYDVDITRGGVVLLFNDEPYAFIQLTTRRRGFVNSRNIGGELLAAATALNMAHVELKKFKDAGFKVPYTMSLTHDYVGINDTVRPNPKTGKQYMNITKECMIFYKATFEKLNSEYPTNVKFKWVKSHTGNKWNEVADQLAAGEWPCGYPNAIRQEITFKQDPSMCDELNKETKKLIKAVNYNRFVTKDKTAEVNALASLEKVQVPSKFNIVDEVPDENTCYRIVYGVKPDVNKLFAVAVSKSIAEYDGCRNIVVKDNEKLLSMLDI